MIELDKISLYSILLPSGMVFLFKKYLDKPLGIISIFILFTMVLEIVNYALFLNGINNLSLFHLFTLVEYAFIILYFIILLERKTDKWLLGISLFLFIVFSILNIVKYEPLNTYPSNQRVAECILIMLLCMYFFWNLFRKSQITNLIHYPHYWLVSGFLLYFAGTFFLNIVGKIAITTDKLGFYAYDIHSVLNIFLNVIYTTVLWMSKRASISER